MLSIIISILAGIAVSTVFRLTLVHSLAGAITPGVIVAIVVVILLMRRAGAKMMTQMADVEKHLRGGRRELALKSLHDGLAGRLWHPLLEGQLRLQIGALEYAAGNLDEAIPQLARASKRPWDSRAYLGCAYFKAKDDEKMVKAFETAVGQAKKIGLAWTVYAWCLKERGKKEEAVAVLERAQKELPTDERIANNLELAKEGKKLKVAPYGEQWSRFMLDGSVPGVPKEARGFAQRPGFRQRPLRQRSKRK